MAEPVRDYSEIVWPWDDDPNWAQPREGATYDRADDENWRLGCGECGLHFPKDIEVGVVAEHWNRHFPDDESRHDKLELNLVWVGLGTPPQPEG